MSIDDATKKELLWIVALGTMFAIVFALLPAADKPPTIMELKKLADANGFVTYAFDNPDFVGDEDKCEKLLVSKEALSQDDLESLNFAAMEDPSWQNRVCIMRDAKIVVPVPDEIVGDLQFFGDKEMIKAIRACLASSRKKGRTRRRRGRRRCFVMGCRSLKFGDGGPESVPAICSIVHYSKNS